ADGNSVWTQRWTSPITNYSAYAYSIAVDNQGNVFTTGFESDGLTDGEFITLKFNSSGVLQWATPYNGSTSSIDYANHIIVDSDGNSYSTGWSGGVFISIALDDVASAYVTGFVFSGGAG